MTAYTRYQTDYRYDWRFTQGQVAHPLNRTSNRAR